MKIYDFDTKFFEYARVQMALQPRIAEEEVEQKYNEMMRSWLNAPATWLNGVKPGEYFKRYDDPADLTKLLEEYMKRDYGVPEPLYSRVVEVGAGCVPRLRAIAADEGRKEALRATAIALMRDIGEDAPVDLYMDLVCRSKKTNELGEMAFEALKALGGAVVDPLLERFDDAELYGRMMILDICAGNGRLDRVYDTIVQGLLGDAEHRGFYAGLLADSGDERALEPLKRAEALTDLEYLDYIEIRDAIERLGGEPGEPREFNGDPAYEALRNL